MAVLDAYPWQDLPEALADEGPLARAHHLALETFDLGLSARCLEELAGIELEGMGVTSRQPSRAIRVDALAPRLTTPALSIVVSAEPELVAFIATRVLDRPFRLGDASLAPSPALLGAWHAVVLELGRRLARHAPPSLETSEHETPTGPGSVVQAWVRLDGRSFGLRLELVPHARLETPPQGDVPVNLRLVAGRALLSRAELDALRVGDALLPNAGWYDPAAAAHELVAVAGGEERGFRLHVSDLLRYVGPAHLPHETPQEEPPMDDPTRESVIASTPVVVRIEVGSVTLPAREWMALRPGDVLSCGVPPRTPVVLRAGGLEFARGELVTVDGQLGVRLLALSHGTEDDTRPQPETATR